jgi:phospholipid:diacylglycerol acyltransferase
MKIYCLYGHGKETERSYYYRDDVEIPSEEVRDCLDANSTCSEESIRTRRSAIDISVNFVNSTPKVRSGVLFGEGDGTVSLLSLGAMCVEGWKRDRYNPSRIPVITHELKHDPTAFDPRGGDKSSDHVDVLGNSELNEAILDIASGHGDRVKDQFFSNIKQYASKIEWDS